MNESQVSKGKLIMAESQREASETAVPRAVSRPEFRHPPSIFPPTKWHSTTTTTLRLLKDSLQRV